MRVFVWSVLLWSCVSFWLGVISLLGGCRHVPAVLDAVEQAVPPPPVVTPTTVPATTTTIPPAPVATGDAIDLSNARTHGTMARIKPADAQIVTRMEGVLVDSKKMYLRWGEAKAHAKAGDHLLLFWDDGAGATGGQFDYLKGPQPVKLLENIHGGRIGGEPKPGQSYYVLWVSADGKRRSAAVRGDNGWVGR